MLFLFWENIWPLRSFCVEELEIILAPNSVLLTGLFLTEYSYNCVIFNWRVVNSRSWKSSCRKRFLADLIRGCLCECTRLGSNIRKSMSVLVAKSWTELQSIPEYAEYAFGSMMREHYHGTRLPHPIRHIVFCHFSYLSNLKSLYEQDL